MAHLKILRRLVALVYVDGKLLFYRVPGAKEYDLPQVDASGLFEKRLLKKFLRENFRISPVLEREVPLSMYEENGLMIEARAFVFKIPELPEQDGLLEILLSEDGAKGYPLTPGAFVLGRRGYLYAPFYMGKVRTVPLIPEYLENAWWKMDCIRFFKVPSKVKKEFRGLVNSPSSMKRINGAFRDICQAYKMDPLEYKAHLAFLERRREELK